jgi:anaerobic dimethyl sulfoxide reductase subunit B (iron-sulfur subunit)
MEKQLGFYLDLQSCSGCKACQIACKDKNGLEVSLLWRRVVEINGGEWLKLGDAWLDNTFTYNLSTACMHCERPICLEVCPTRAISKRDDGVVLIDANRCMGCRYCEWACPYGAPQFNPTTGVMTKCNLCYDYLDAGKPPACVSACQMRVLEFGELDELRAKYGPLNDVHPLPAPSLTKPAVVFTPHRDAVHAETSAARISNGEEI